jgi:hypothetical protein
VNQPDLELVRQSRRPVNRKRHVVGFAGAIDGESSSAVGNDVRSPERVRATGSDG